MLLVVHVGLLNQQKKNFCEKQQQTVASDVCNLTFFTPFAGPTKASIFVFLEVVPRLAFCRLLQPVFRFLLRLAAAAVVVGFFFDPLLLPPQNSLQNRYPQNLVQSQCLQPEFHRHFLIKFYFFLAIAADTYNDPRYIHSSV